MQVFRAFLKVVWNKRVLLFVYGGIFLALAIGMASMGGKEKEKVFEEERYEVAVFDYDQSKESRAFSDYLTTKLKPVKCEDDSEKLLDQLFARNIRAVIYIKEGYGESLRRGDVEHLTEVTTIPGAMCNETITGYIDRYMGTVGAFLKSGYTTAEAMDKTGAVLEKKAEVMMEGKKDAGDSHSKVYYFFLYIPYVLVSCCIQAVGFSIHTFQRREVRDRMNVSAYSFRRRNLELWAGTALCGFAFAALFVLVSSFLYRDGLFGTDRLLMLANLAVSVLWTLGLTYFISVSLKKESAFAMAGTVLGLVVAFLGGMFVPLAYMGDGIKLLSHFVPSYWYVTALDIVDGGSIGRSIPEFLTGLGMQAGFAAAFFAAGLGLAARQRKNG